MKLSQQAAALTTLVVLSLPLLLIAGCSPPAKDAGGSTPTNANGSTPAGSMLLANEKLTRRIGEAGHLGDYNVVIESWADDVIMHVPGRNPLAGDYRTKEGILDYVKKFEELTGSTEKVTEVVDVLASAERGLLIIKMRIERGEEHFEFERDEIYRIENGKVAEIWIRDGDPYVIDALFN